jgi:hypothetical protein
LIGFGGKRDAALAVERPAQAREFGRKRVVGRQIKVSCFRALAQTPSEFGPAVHQPGGFVRGAGDVDAGDGHSGCGERVNQVGTKTDRVGFSVEARI